MRIRCSVLTLKIKLFTVFSGVIENSALFCPIVHPHPTQLPRGAYLHPNFHSSKIKAQGWFQFFLILQCRSDIPHISIMFQALDLEDTFTLPLIHRYTKKIHQNNAVGMWDLARGRGVVGARCIRSTVTKVANCKLKYCRWCGPEKGVCLRCYKAMPTLKCIITESGNFKQKNC